MTSRGIGITIVGFLSIGATLVGTDLRAQSAKVATSSSSAWGTPIDSYTLESPAFESTATFPPVGFETSSIGNSEGSDDSRVTSFGEPAQYASVQRARQESALDRVTDPTSPASTIRFRELWNWPVSSSDPDNQEFQFRPTIPFKAWGRDNILRVTIPYDITGENGAGLDNVTILDLAVYTAEWGRWGIGPVVRFNPADGSDAATFQIGPAAGAVSEDEHWTVGLLAQNFFGDGVAESRIQPILTYKFDQQWALGVGEFEFRYDWENSTWTQLPLGAELDYIANICGQKVQLFLNPQFNFADNANNSGWTVFIGATLIVPDR
jgi:hypothetical protein